MKTKKFFYVILFSLELLLPLIAFLVIFFQKKSFSSIFLIKNPLILQIVTGILIGMILGIIMAYIAKKVNYFNIIKKLIMDLIYEFKINFFDIFLIAFLAGFCEEILFRGVLQEILGIFLSSFVFIFLHGYFNPFSLNITVWGCIMYCLSLGIGFLYENYGIFAAISFHFSFDFIVLYLFYRTGKNQFEIS